MGLFSKKIGTVFFKEESETGQFIDKLEKLIPKSSEELKKEIEKQLKLAQYGMVGENNVIFELKHSGMDMYVLHDIYLEWENLSAQIDFIIITRKRIYVIECKNLIGNIEIDSTGSFIRSYELFGKHIKEGIYSPITQNQRHLQILKEIRKSAKRNVLTKLMFEKYFDNNYKSIVVLANPKTYLNAKFSKKDVKEQVVRADQLIARIRAMDAEVKDTTMSESEMKEIAAFYLECNIANRSDYAHRYEELVKEMGVFRKEDEKEQIEKTESITEIEFNVHNKIVSRLKEYRRTQSQKENIKPYYIFNDTQMRDLIERKPRNKEELIKVSGFGVVKVEKYGDEIIQIFAQEC